MDYDALVSAIQDMSAENNDPTFTSNIPVFVNNAEKRIYQIVKIPALRKNATTYLEPSSPYLTLPTDYLAPWEFAVISSGGAYNYLLLKDVSFIREVYPYAASTAVPKYYAQFDENTYLLGPTPSTALQSELHYFYYPESIVTASTTWLGDNFENVLLYGCLVEAAAFLKSEEDIVKQYAEQFSVNLKLLQEYANGKLKSGSYRQ